MSLVCDEKPYFGPSFDDQTKDCLFLDSPGSSLISSSFGTDVLPGLREEILSGKRTEYSYHQIKNSIMLWESREPGSVMRMIEGILRTKLDTFLEAINCFDPLAQKDGPAPLNFESFVQLWDHYRAFYQKIETVLSVFFPLTNKRNDSNPLSLIDLIGYGIFYEKIFLPGDSSVPLFDPSVGFGELSPDAERQMAELYRTIYKFDKSIIKIHNYSPDSCDPAYARHVNLLWKTLQVLGGYRPAIEAVVKEIDRILVRTKNHQRISNVDYAEIIEWCQILAHQTNDDKPALVHACYLKYFQPRLLNYPRKNYKIEILTISKLSIGRLGYSMVEQVRDVERSGKIKNRLHEMQILTGQDYVGLECQPEKCSPYYLRNKLWKITKESTRLDLKAPPVIEYYLVTSARAYHSSARRTEETPTKIEWDYLHGHVTFDLCLGKHNIDVRAHMIQAMVIGHFGDLYEIAIETLEEEIGIPHEMMLKITSSLVESGLFYINQESQALTIDINNESLQRKIDLVPLYLKHFSC